CCLSHKRFAWLYCGLHLLLAIGSSPKPVLPLVQSAALVV
ncbi:6262_t:CDS:1, partial [Gigaspora margarita]